MHLSLLTNSSRNNEKKGEKNGDNKTEVKKTEAKLAKKKDTFKGYIYITGRDCRI